MTQKAYLRKVLQKFDIGCEIKFVSTLLAPYFKISANMSPKTVDEHEYMSQVPYASSVGGLMYSMICTTLDFSQALSMISRYIHDHGMGH